MSELTGKNRAAGMCRVLPPASQQFGITAVRNHSRYASQQVRITAPQLRQFGITAGEHRSGWASTRRDTVFGLKALALSHWH
jgi:hypothetical protein